MLSLICHIKPRSQQSQGYMYAPTTEWQHCYKFINTYLLSSGLFQFKGLPFAVGKYFKLPANFYHIQIGSGHNYDHLQRLSYANPDFAILLEVHADDWHWAALRRVSVAGIALHNTYINTILIGSEKLATHESTRNQ